MNRHLVVQTFSVPISLRFVEGQADFWRQHGFEVHFLTDDGPDVEPFVIRNNAIHRIIPFKRSFSIVNTVHCFWLLVQYFRKHKPLIVHGNTPKAAFITMLAAVVANVPIRIYEMHGLPLETAKPITYPLFWLIEKLTCTLATSVMAVSQSLRQAAIDQNVVNTSKINVNHNGSCNGVDTQRIFNLSNISHQNIVQLRSELDISANDSITGFVGRLTFEKGIRELYEAWQLVKIQRPNTKLLLIGDSDKRQGLPPDWVHKLSNDVTIRCVGYVENVVDYYAMIDFLVLPSYREGLGNVVLEAAAMHKPAIVTNITGLKNAIIENKTGLFSTSHSVIDLAKKIIYYIDNQHITAIHGIAAHKRVISDFVPEAVWTAKLNHYKRLIAALK
jgi:glycosyltransferase involved in cell wall biosynthesis